MTYIAQIYNFMLDITYCQLAKIIFILFILHLNQKYINKQKKYLSKIENNDNKN
jgi:hypothetical protein